MVLQFIGFVGGWQNPGFQLPASAAVLGAALTTWGTFLPSFFFILASGLHIAKFSAKRSGLLPVIELCSLAGWLGGVCDLLPVQR
jgi:hypothetical protein